MNNVIIKHMSPEASTATPKLFERIIKLLASQNIEYKVIDHEPIDGSATGSSTVAGTNSDETAKSLVMMVDGIKPIMVVLRGPDRVNKRVIKRLTNSGDVRLATPEEVLSVTETEIGTLPPFGSLFNLITYVDKHLLEEREIAFGTGLRTKTIVISSDAFKKIANSIIDDFVEN